MLGNLMRPLASSTGGTRTGDDASGDGANTQPPQTPPFPTVERTAASVAPPFPMLFDASKPTDVGERKPMDVEIGGADSSTPADGDRAAGPGAEKETAPDAAPATFASRAAAAYRARPLVFLGVGGLLLIVVIYFAFTSRSKSNGKQVNDDQTEGGQGDANHQEGELSVSEEPHTEPQAKAPAANATTKAQVAEKCVAARELACPADLDCMVEVRAGHWQRAEEGKQGTCQDELDVMKQTWLQEVKKLSAKGKARQIVVLLTEAVTGRAYDASVATLPIVVSQLMDFDVDNDILGEKGLIYQLAQHLIEKKEEDNDQLPNLYVARDLVKRLDLKQDIDQRGQNTFVAPALVKLLSVQQEQDKDPNMVDICPYLLEGSVLTTPLSDESRLSCVCRADQTQQCRDADTDPEQNQNSFWNADLCECLPQESNLRRGSRKELKKEEEKALSDIKGLDDKEKKIDQLLTFVADRIIFRELAGSPAVSLQSPQKAPRADLAVLAYLTYIQPVSDKSKDDGKLLATASERLPLVDALEDAKYGLTVMEREKASALDVIDDVLRALDYFTSQMELMMAQDDQWDRRLRQFLKMVYTKFDSVHEPDEHKLGLSMKDNMSVDSRKMSLFAELSGMCPVILKGGVKAAQLADEPPYEYPNGCYCQKGFVVECYGSHVNNGYVYETGIFVGINKRKSRGRTTARNLSFMSDWYKVFKLHGNRDIQCSCEERAQKGQQQASNQGKQ